MRTRRVLAGVALAAAAWAVPAGAAMAGKPSDGGATGGGAIYFSHGNPTEVWRMNSDGTGKAKLAVTGGVPSHSLHGGRRWFLQAREIAGETYPDGWARWEIHAVSDDATTVVQLTTQAALEAHSSITWRPGDAQISWAARRWSNGSVVEGGIYLADVVFDTSGNVTGLLSQPTTPAIALSLVTFSSDTQRTRFSGLWPDVRNHDWEPSGSRIAYDRFSAGGVRLADAAGSDTFLVSGGAARWAPDATRIAYDSAGGVSTITPSGTGATLIASNGRSKGYDYFVSGAHWSPTGSHLGFLRSWTGLPHEQDVCRVAASGGSTTNLTSDKTGCRPIGWR